MTDYQARLDAEKTAADAEFEAAKAKAAKVDLDGNVVSVIAANAASVQVCTHNTVRGADDRRQT